MIGDAQVHGRHRSYELRGVASDEKIESVRGNMRGEGDMLFKSKRIKDVEKRRIRWRNRWVDMEVKVPSDQKLRRKGGKRF